VQATLETLEILEIRVRATLETLEQEMHPLAAILYKSWHNYAM
jgi:hypothetical protein